MSNIERLEAIVARLPEAERVDIAEWGDHPSFRVRGKNFVFSDRAAEQLSVKLSKDEAAAVVGSVAGAEPTGYGLGRHGWVSVDLTVADVGWDEVEEWVVTSYCLIAPKTLARSIGEEGER